MNQNNQDNSLTPAIRRSAWQWLAAGLAACIVGIAAAYLAASLTPPRTDQPQAQTAPQPPTEDVQRAADTDRSIIFSASAGRRPAITSPLLPASAKTIYGFFQLPIGVDARQLTARWTWNGEAADPKTARITPGAEGQRRALLTLDSPIEGKAFGPGIGEVQILNNGKTVRQGAFVLAENAANVLRQDAQHHATIDTIVAARGVTKQGKPREEGKKFRPNERIAIVFEYRGALPGDSVVIRWYCGGRQIPQAATTVNLDNWNGRAYAWIRPAADRNLPPGEYEARVYSEQAGKELATCRFAVLEPSPTPPP